MEKDNPFKVPGNYFQNFKLEIMDQLPQKEQKKNVLNFKQAILKWSAVAAVILLFIVVGIGFMDTNQSKNINNSGQNTTDQTLNNSEQQYAALENDYLLFLEDEATLSMYKDVLSSDDF